MKTAGKKYDAVIYPGAGHGFKGQILDRAVEEFAEWRHADADQINVTHFRTPYAYPR